MPTTQELADTFRQLHARDGAFVIPNPWDPGSARMLQGLGFEALATTSSGFAFSLGRLDGEVTVDEKLKHCRELCESVEIPISADLENCFADDPRAAAQNLLAVAQSGIVGGSIEDWSGTHIYDFNHAVERVAAAVEAVRSLDFHFTLTARAEGLLRGHADLDDAIKRLAAFAAAGADVVYAPSLRTLDEVRAVANAVDVPQNVLAPGLNYPVTVAELTEAGAQRISIGGALARAAIGATIRAGEEMRETGSFGWLSDMASGAEIASLLK
jgi:2-methylisocitrate lyase-like PEP mutase family enzyme